VNTLAPTLGVFLIVKMIPIETIKQNAKDFPPGILKEEDKDKFQNLIGKTVIATKIKD
jgi:hypothetical protein